MDPGSLKGLDLFRVLEDETVFTIHDLLHKLDIVEFYSEDIGIESIISSYISIKHKKSTDLMSLKDKIDYLWGTVCETWTRPSPGVLTWSFSFRRRK